MTNTELAAALRRIALETASSCASAAATSTTATSTDVPLLREAAERIKRMDEQLRSVRQEKAPPSGSCPIEKRPLSKSSEKLRR